MLAGWFLPDMVSSSVPAIGNSQANSRSGAVSRGKHVVHDRLGRQKRGFYSHFGSIEQVRVGGRLQRRVGASHVALVAAADVGENAVEIAAAAGRLDLRQAAAGTDLGAR